MISQWYLWCLIHVAQALIILGSDIRATPCTASTASCCTCHQVQYAQCASTAWCCFQIFQFAEILPGFGVLVLCKVYNRHLALCDQLYDVYDILYDYMMLCVPRWARAANSQQVQLSSLALTDVCWNTLLHASVKSSHVYSANQFVLSLGLGCCHSSSTSQKIVSYCFILHGNMENKTWKKNCKAVAEPRCVQGPWRRKLQPLLQSLPAPCSLHPWWPRSGATSVRIVLFTSFHIFFMPSVYDSLLLHR